MHPLKVFYYNTNIGLNIAKVSIESNVKTLINAMPNYTFPRDLNEYEESIWWDGPIHSNKPLRK